MNFDSPLGGHQRPDGIWVPRGALEVKADRSVTGVPPQPRATYSGVLRGIGEAENRFKDFSSYLAAVKTVPWVWAAVSVIAYNFANNPYQYLEEDGTEVDDKYDPFLRLWHRPNPRQTGFHFRELTSHYLSLVGEAFWTLEDWSGLDQPQEMYAPNPARMIVVQDKHTGDVAGYVYNSGQGYIPYEPWEVIHLKFANPLDEMRGLGAIEAMENTLNVIAEMTGTQLSYWKSGGRITGVLQTDQPVDDLTFEKLVQRWRDFTSGARDRSRFKTAILEQGLKYQPIAEGLRGLDLTKMDLAKRDEVLANFGVPKQKLGIYDADTGYKADDADRFFYGETMEPLFTRVEDGGLQPLVEIFNPDRVFRFARRNYEDDTVKLANSKVMQSLGFTVGEIFEYLGVEMPDDIRKDMVMPGPGTVPYTLKQLKQMSDTAVEHPQGEPPPPALPPRAPTPGNPDGAGRPPGAQPLPGVPSAANGRSGAVDGNGHLPNRPVTGQTTRSTDKAAYLTEENLKYLTEAERQSLRAQYERDLEGARAVDRARRRPVLPPPSSVTGKGLARINAKAASAVGARMPARAAQALAAGELMRRATQAIKTRLVPKYKTRVREAFDRQRKTLTPVLKDSIDAFKKINAESLSDGEKQTRRREWLRERWPHAPLQAVVTALHREAANDGWRVAKRSLGFAGKGFEAWEVKAAEPATALAEGLTDAEVQYLASLGIPVEEWVSGALAGRYPRLIGRRITDVDETTIQDVEGMVMEGLRRGYSPLQIANGNADEAYDGVSSIFADDYRAELIARTESMFAANWGATTSYADSGVDEAEAMDGSGDPECAERDGQIFEIDPDTGRPVDDAGEPIEDHPNGTLAWAPHVVVDQLRETGALDGEGDGAEGPVETFVDEDGELAADDWEMKYGTGQNNNPEGHNQYTHHGGGGGSSSASHPSQAQQQHPKKKPGTAGAEGHAGGAGAGHSSGGGHGSGGGHASREGRHGSGGGGGGGGGGSRGGRGPRARRGRRGRRGRTTHTHRNGVTHSHHNGHLQHAHGRVGHGTQEEWNAYREATRDTQWDQKGDRPGHEFHGNQYTEGGAATIEGGPKSHQGLRGTPDEADRGLREHLNAHRFSTFKELSDHLKEEHDLSHEDVLQQAIHNGLVAYHDADHGTMETRRPLGYREARVYDPDFGWGVKSPDGAFFTDDEGVVHPIRNAGGYDPKIGDKPSKPSKGSGPSPHLRDLTLDQRVAAIDVGRAGALMTGQYQEMLKSGMSHRDALAAALQWFGHQTKQKVTAQDVNAVVETLNERLAARGEPADIPKVSAKDSVAIAAEVNAHITGSVGNGIIAVMGRDDKLRETFDAAKASIDKVHEDGILPGIHMTDTPWNAGPGVTGQYAYSDYGKTAVGIYVKTDLAPGEPDRREMSAVHEMGHFLDNQALSATPSDEYESDRGWEGKSTPAMNALMDTLHLSGPVQMLQAGLRTAEATGNQNGANVLAYYTSPREVFARAYSQYIAARADSRPIIDSINDILDKDHWSITSQHWGWGRFTSEVVPKFDELFRERGWKVQPGRTIGGAA